VTVQHFGGDPRGGVDHPYKTLGAKKGVFRNVGGGEVYYPRGWETLGGSGIQETRILRYDAKGGFPYFNSSYFFFRKTTAFFGLIGDEMFQGCSFFFNVTKMAVIVLPLRNRVARFFLRHGRTFFFPIPITTFTSPSMIIEGDAASPFTPRSGKIFPFPKPRRPTPFFSEAHPSFFLFSVKVLGKPFSFEAFGELTLLFFLEETDFFPLIINQSLLFYLVNYRIMLTAVPFFFSWKIPRGSHPLSFSA